MKVFLSHTGKDKPNVRQVGCYLESRGISVWLDQWEMVPGDSLIEKISEGVEGSDKLVVFLSPASIESPWVKKELNGGLVMEIAEDKGLGGKFVIPVLLEACKVPFFLREKIYANFTDKSFDDACEELIAGIEDRPVKRTIEPFSNAVVRRYDLESDAAGPFQTVLEFTSNLSPISGCTVEIKTGGYGHVFERVGVSGNPISSGSVANSYTNTSKSSDGFIFYRRFAGPDLKKGISYYVSFTSEKPLDVSSVTFLDGYGGSI
jgi:hypothetical protein